MRNIQNGEKVFQWDPSNIAPFPFLTNFVQILYTIYQKPIFFFEMQEILTKAKNISININKYIKK